MQLNISLLLCSVVCLLSLCFAPVCPSKHSKCRHAQIHQKTHGTKKYCDPAYSNQTAGAITQVRQLFVELSVAHCTGEEVIAHALALNKVKESFSVT